MHFLSTFYLKELKSDAFPASLKNLSINDFSSTLQNKMMKTEMDWKAPIPIGAIILFTGIDDCD